MGWLKCSSTKTLFMVNINFIIFFFLGCKWDIQKYILVIKSLWKFYLIKLSLKLFLLSVASLIKSIHFFLYILTKKSMKGNFFLYLTQLEINFLSIKLMPLFNFIFHLISANRSSVWFFKHFFFTFFNLKSFT